MSLRQDKEKINKTEKPRKFEYIYKDDDGCESVWKYDLDKFPNGPISVEYKYTVKYLKELEIRKRRGR